MSNEIARSEWRNFLSTVATGDLRRVLQYFAKKDGRKQPSFRPSCLDPLDIDGRVVAHPQRKAKELARFFAKKFSADGKPADSNNTMVRRAIRERYEGGIKTLVPPISKDEIQLAVIDLPMNRAPGPDQMPADFFKRLPALLETLPSMYTHMIETNQIPDMARKYHILPFDKAGKDPSQCSSNRPISLLNTYMKLLEMVIARRTMGYLEPSLTDSQ